MTIRNKENFKNVVLALPEFTGCRWYNPEIPPNPQEKPKGYYNNGRRITGPDVHLLLTSQEEHRSSSAGIGMDTSAPSDSASGIPTPDLGVSPSSVGVSHSGNSNIASSVTPEPKQVADQPAQDTLINKSQVINAVSSSDTAVTATSVLVDSSVLGSIKPPEASNSPPTFQIGSATSLHYISPSDVLVSTPSIVS